MLKQLNKQHQELFEKIFGTKNYYKYQKDKIIEQNMKIKLNIIKILFKIQNFLNQFKKKVKMKIHYLKH